MSSDRRPWYKWFPKDFVADEKVKSLSPLSELVYRRLLDTMWQSSACVLLNDCLRLANVAGGGLTDEQFEKAWSEIQTPGFELFKISDCGKFIYSERMNRQVEEIEIKQKAGKKGGQAKSKQKPSKSQAKAKYARAREDADTDIKDNPPTPHSGGNVEYSKSFDEWWSIYPNKVGKLAAYKSWQKIGKSKSASVSELTNSLKRQIESNHFRGTDGQDYIPKPATWLNQGRWMDEIKTGSSEPRRPRPPMFDPDNQYGDE